MKYLYLIPIFTFFLAIGIYYLSIEIIKPFGYAISKVAIPKKLLSGLDYVILNEHISNNTLILTIKFFGNISNNFCIEEVKINNLSKEYEYESILTDIYKIKIKNTSSYNKLQLRLCNGFLIEEP